MAKYLRFFCPNGWYLSAGAGVALNTNALVEVTDMSFATAEFNTGPPTNRVRIHLWNRDGRSFFTLQTNASTGTVDQWGAESFLTHLNGIIVRAEGEGWRKVIYDVGAGVGDNPLVQGYGKGAIIFQILGALNPSSGNTVASTFREFNMQDYSAAP